MLEDYPKKITLPEGLSLTLRPMTRDDQYALYRFFPFLKILFDNGVGDAAIHSRQWA